MKKLIFILFLLTLFNHGFCQYDYFQWEKNSTAYAGRTISANSGIAVDQYNRVFYIDNTSKKIYWEYGVVLTGAPLARSNSNLIYKYDNYGNYLFYIGADNKIKCLKWLYNQSPLAWTFSEYASGTVANGSFIEYGINNDQIFYISTNNIVSNYWKNSSGSGFAPLISTASAKSWSNIIYKDNAVFYVGSDGKIAGLEYNTTTKLWSKITTLSSALIKDNSRIFAFSKNQIFYVQASDSRIGYYWKNTSGSGNNTVLGTSTQVLTGSPILSRYWNDLNYIGTDNKIHCLYFDYSKWDDYKLNNGCTISSPFLTQSVDGYFYFNESTSFYYIKPLVKTDYVYRKGTKLFINNSLYTPFIVNYTASIYSFNGTDFFVGPDPHYDNDWRDGVGTTQATLLDLFKAHLLQIKNLGFTAIRFNGLNVSANRDDITNTDASLYFNYTNPLTLASTKVKLDATTRQSLFSLYKTIFTLCKEQNLKVNFFTGLSNDDFSHTACHSTYTTYLSQLALSFQNDERIFCYSDVLEPDMAKSIINCKNQISSLTQDWYNALRTNDKNHLITVGLANEPLCLLSWDPSIVKCDFLTFHIYPHIDKLTDMTFNDKRKDIQWITNIMKSLNKPWIVGETSFPGSRSSSPFVNTGTYTDQQNYGLFMRDNVFASGASALTWWQFHDVYWPGGDLNSDLQAKYSTISGWDNYGSYLGLIKHDGTAKLISNIFLGYTPIIGGSCTTNPIDYYNQDISNPVFTLSGKIIDSDSNPIKDAVILGVESWTAPANRSSYTHTQSNGTFTLKTNHPVTIIEVSAMGKEITYDESPISASTYTNLVLNNYGCAVTLKSTTLHITDLDEKNSAGIIKIYPNPTNDKVKIEVENLAEVEVYSSLGQRVLSKKNYTGDSFIEIDLQNQTKGIYILKCKYTTGDFAFSKITKK